MTTHDRITALYAAFNRRDIDAVFTHLSDSIDWPKASEGGRVIGKDAIRAYWLRQWAEFNPTVEPTDIRDIGPNRVEVTVHQVVRTLDGTLLFDGTVHHIYTVADGLLQRMDIPDANDSAFHRSE